MGLASQNHKKAVCLSPESVRNLNVPRSRPGATTPWVDGSWFVAPLLKNRDQARGVVAIRRVGGTFEIEEREVLALLAQMASSALNSTELSRGVESSESRLRALVETAPTGIIEVDLVGHVRWWNRVAGHVFAWPLYDDGAAIEPEFPDSAVEGIEALRIKTLRDEVPSTSELIAVEIHGRRRDLTLAATLLTVPNESSRSVLMLVDDVTDHRELKAEVDHAHQMELRGRVASSVAHDFNNLLTVISGYSEILTRELTAQEHALAIVKDIQSTTSRASVLTTQLQSIGRTAPLAPVVLSPAEVVHTNAEVIERILGGEIRPTWSLNHDAGNIYLDAGQFEQMMLNLVINARDAMPHGGEIHIAVDRTTVDVARGEELNVQPGEFVLITVSDTGIGMDESTRQHCFDTFFTTKGPLKGTGLGLAAARRLVEGSGGAINCQSQLGKGTTFEALIPLTREIMSEQLPDLIAERPRGSATVLLAEDDHSLRRLITQVLTRHGYRVLATETGEQALDVARGHEGEIDLLISDVVMPGMAGPEVARSLQEKNPELRVLLTSGTASASVLEQLNPKTGAFLAKPFRPSGLIDAVYDLVTRRDATQPTHDTGGSKR